MKWIKWWIAGLLVWQAISLFATKPHLKKKLATAEWTDKIKVVFDELVTFNKWLIDSIDISKLKWDIVFRIEHLQDDINKLSSEWNNLNQEKITQRINYLKDSTDNLKSDVGTYVQDLDEKHQLTEKLSKLKEHINTLQSKLQE